MQPFYTPQSDPTLPQGSAAPPLGPAETLASAVPPVARTARTFDLVVRFVLGISLTPVFVSMTVRLQQYQLLAVVLVTLVIVSVLGGGHGLLERYPLLGRIKLLGGVLRLTGDLDAFYRAHPPRSFILYSIYPLYALIGSIASPIVRREVLLHLRLMLVVTILILLDLAASYGKLYPPYLSWKDALSLLGIQLGVVVVLSLIYLMPMVTTVYAFASSGKHWLMRGFVLGSVLLSIPLGVVTYLQTRDSMGWLERGRLSARLEKPLFKQHLREETEMYLNWASEHGAYDGIGDKPVMVPSGAFQRMVQGLVPGTEDRALSIVALRGPGGVWTALRMLQSKRPYLLIVRAPRGSVATHWAQLPPAIQESFRHGEIAPKETGVDRVFREVLIDDLPTR